MRNNKTRILVVSAILGSLSAVLMMFDFPIFLAPSFYKIDFADIPGLIGGFALGPMAALLTQIIKIFIKLLIKGTQTMFVGEAANFIISLSLMLPASIIYQRNRTKKQAILGMFIGSLVMIVVAGVVNYYMLIPAYVKFMNFPLEAIISMGNNISKLVNNKLSLILICTMPFNFVKALITDVLTFFLYKRISSLLTGKK